MQPAIQSASGWIDPDKHELGAPPIRLARFCAAQAFVPHLRV